jgi:hypothetical protein
MERTFDIRLRVAALEDFYDEARRGRSRRVSIEEE